MMTICASSIALLIAVSRRFTHYYLLQRPVHLLYPHLHTHHFNARYFIYDCYFYYQVLI